MAAGECIEVNSVSVNQSCPVGFNTPRSLTFDVTAHTERTGLRWRRSVTSSDILSPSDGAIAKKVVQLFNEGGFDICTLFYSQFKSVISQIPTTQQIIPAGIASAPAAAADGGNAVYEYEPEPGEILSDLIPRNISVQVFRALLENAAGEMGAKMSAMDNATRNAGDMINKLSITYNRQRQAQITKELIEIISGAEAL